MRTIITILIFFNALNISSYGKKTMSNQLNLILRPNSTIDTIDFVITDFKKIPSEYTYRDRAYLIDKIVPVVNYVYWECLYKDIFTEDNRGSIIVYNGDSLKYSTITKKINSNWGFFVECRPGVCFSYIVGVRDDKTTDLIATNEELKNFIGHIDNIEEAILLAKINGYWYDTDTIIGGAYKERENDYLLYLLDYSSTPEIYKSVKAILTKDGDFRVIDKSIYKRTDVYISD